MNVLSLLGTNEMAEATFRRDGDGWIFKTSPLSGWFGLHKSYRVDDEKKAELKALFVRMYGQSFISAMAMIPIFVVLLPWTGGEIKAVQLAIVIATSAAVSLFCLALYFRHLRKALASAQPSDQTVSYGDSVRAYVRTMPLWRAIAYTALSMLLLAGAIFAVTTNSNPAINKFGVAMFGVCTLYFIAITLVKIVSRRTA